MRRAARITIGLAVLIFSFETAGAYSIYPTASGAGPQISDNLSNSFGNLFLPIQNFVRSINAVGPVGGGAAAVRVNSAPPQANNTGNKGVNTVQGAFVWFDHWLYGIAGFHISGFFTIILNLFSWLLGIVKAGVDWLLSQFH